MTNIKTFQLVVFASMYVAASSHSADKNYVNSVTLAEAVDWGCTFDRKNDYSRVFHYFTQDHLGNNSTVTSEDGTVEQIMHYYPFGGTFNDAGVNASLQQYKYNGKELDRVAGLNTYDYGARQMQKHDPTWKKTTDELKEHVKNILNELR